MDRCGTPTSATDSHDLLEHWAGWAPVASAVLDADLVCRWANPRFADLAGATPQAAGGRPLSSLLALDPDHLLRLRRVATGGLEARFTVVVPPAQVPGGDVPLQAERWRLHAFPVHHDDDALVGIVAVDVTDDAGLDLADPVPVVEAVGTPHAVADPGARTRRAGP